MFPHFLYGYLQTYVTLGSGCYYNFHSFRLSYLQNQTLLSNLADNLSMKNNFLSTTKKVIQEVKVSILLELQLNNREPKLY